MARRTLIEIGPRKGKNRKPEDYCRAWWKYWWLVRVAIGPLQLGELPKGSARLTPGREGCCGQGHSTGRSENGFHLSSGFLSRGCRDSFRSRCGCRRRRRSDVSPERQQETPGEFRCSANQARELWLSRISDLENLEDGGLHLRVGSNLVQSRRRCAAWQRPWRIPRRPGARPCW